MRPRSTLAAGAASVLVAALLAAGCSQGGGPDGVVSYHHLRLELSTGSRGARLTLLDASPVLSARPVSTGGGPERSGVTMRSMWVARGKNEPAGADPISIVADYALDATGMPDELGVMLETAGDGPCVVRLYKVAGDLIVQIGAFEAQDSRPREFSLPLGGLESKKPLRGDRAGPVEREALAFYYQWYDSVDNWTSRQLSDRPLKPYASNDEEAMRRHIEEAKGAGIGGFLASWWGPASFTDENLKKLLEVASGMDFKIAVNFETLKDQTPGREPVPLSDREIFSWLKYLLSEYGDHPAMMKAGGKPLVALWASDSVRLETWKGIFERLRSESLDATYLGMVGAAEPQLGALEVFDGLHAYSVLALTENDGSAEKLRASYAETGRGVRYYHLLSGSRDPEIWAPTVQPGYDDRLIPGREGMELPRRDGACFRETFAAAAASNADLLFFTTWNEWWEHTYIEPSEKYGDTYLRITRELLGSWK